MRPHLLVDKAVWHSLQRKHPGEKSRVSIGKQTTVMTLEKTFEKLIVVKHTFVEKLVVHLDLLSRIHPLGTNRTHVIAAGKEGRERLTLTLARRGEKGVKIKPREYEIQNKTI